MRNLKKEKGKIILSISQILVSSLCFCACVCEKNRSELGKVTQRLGLEYR